MRNTKSCAPVALRQVCSLLVDSRRDMYRRHAGTHAVQQGGRAGGWADGTKR